MVRRILTVLFALAFIALTSGIAVYKHFCSCTKLVSTALFVEPACHSCCVHHPAEPNDMPCCHHAETGKPSSANYSSDEDCCQTTVNLIVLKTDFQVTGTKQLLAASLLAILFFVLPLPEVDTKFNANQLLALDPDPPVYGRIFLIGIRQLKLSDPVC